MVIGSESPGACRQVPSFLGLGPEKSGSTSLFNYLAQHPQIGMSPIKNLKYFVRDWDDAPGLRSAGFTYDEYLR